MTEDRNSSGSQAENEGSKDPSDSTYELRPVEIVRKGSGEIKPRISGQPGNGSTVVVMSRKALSTLLVVILVLALAVGALLYSALGHKDPGNAPVAQASTTSASPTPTQTAPSTQPSSSPTAEASSSSTATTTDMPLSASTTLSPTSTSPTSAVEQASTASGSTSGAAPIAGSPTYLGAPVDGGVWVQVGQDVEIERADYPQSVAFRCPVSGVDWNVAGSSSFSAIFGIVDGAAASVGVVDTIKFTDQEGNVLNISKTQLGHPQEVKFSLKGVERLVMECTRGGNTFNSVALGNASIAQ